MDRASFERVTVFLKMLLCWLKSSKSKKIWYLLFPDRSQEGLWKYS